MKWFEGLVVYALPLAALVSFMFGGLWYGALSKQWMNAAGLTKDRIDAAGGQTPVVLVLTFVAQFVMAWMFAGVLLHMRKAGIAPTGVNGMLSGLFLWLGFIFPVLLVSHRYQLQKASLTVIDSAYWLGVLLIQGFILGRWGIAA